MVLSLTKCAIWAVLRPPPTIDSVIDPLPTCVTHLAIRFSDKVSYHDKHEQNNNYPKGTSYNP